MMHMRYQDVMDEHSLISIHTHVLMCVLMCVLMISRTGQALFVFIFSMEAIVQVNCGDRKLFVDLSSPTCLSFITPRCHHKSSAYCVKSYVVYDVSER